MFRGKTFVRSLLVLFLLAGLLVGALVPTLTSVRAAPKMQDICGLTMAQWTFDNLATGANLSPAYSSLAGDVASVTASAGSGLTSPTISTTSSHSSPNNWFASGFASGASLNTANNDYFQFALDTTNYSGVSLTFYALRSNAGPDTMQVYYSTDGVTFTDLAGTYSIDIAYPVSAFVADLTGLTNTSGVTYIRVYGWNASSGGGTLHIDDVTVTGCQPATPTPTATDTSTITNTPTATSTSTSTGTPTNTSTPTDTGTPTSTPTITSTPCPITSHTLLINEVGWMGTKSSSSDEWVELYNPSACTFDLTNWQLKGSNSYYTTGNFTITFTTGSIAPGGYFVIAANTGVFQNFTPDLVTSTLSLPNYYQVLQLISPGSAQVDTANYAGKYSWPAGSTSPNYASMERYYVGGVPAADSPAGWVTYAGPTGPTSTNVKDRNGNYILGTPGGPNWAATVTITPSPTPTRYRTPTSRPPTPFAHVVINEFLPRAGFDWNNDGEVNVYDEFIEIENLGPINVNLQGWKLDNPESLGSSPFTLTAKTLKPGERAIYYGSQTHILLLDSGGLIRLINTRGVIVDARSYSAVKYPDQPHCRIPDGEGYWRFPCFPTPGTENTLTGTLPSTPPSQTYQPPVCLFADTTPEEFRQAECNAFGAEVWNRKYWDDQAGADEFVVPDAFSKWQTIVE